MSFIQAMAAIEGIARSSGIRSRPKVTIDFATEIDRAIFRDAVLDELSSLTFVTGDREDHKYDQMKGAVHGVDVEIL